MEVITTEVLEIWINTKTNECCNVAMNLSAKAEGVDSRQVLHAPNKPPFQAFSCLQRGSHGWIVIWMRLWIPPRRSSQSAPLELLSAGWRASASSLSLLPTDSPAGCNLCRQRYRPASNSHIVCTLLRLLGSVVYCLPLHEKTTDLPYW